MLLWFSQFTACDGRLIFSIGSSLYWLLNLKKKSLYYFFRSKLTHTDNADTVRSTSLPQSNFMPSHRQPCLPTLLLRFVWLTSKLTNCMLNRWHWIFLFLKKKINRGDKWGLRVRGYTASWIWDVYADFRKLIILSK